MNNLCDWTFRLQGSSQEVDYGWSQETFGAYVKVKLIYSAYMLWTTLQKVYECKEQIKPSSYTQS